MTPAHPPLPTPANLPFQFSSGSQTSKRICESPVGAITPATRQNGGRLPITFVEPGGVNDPVVTACAEVIVVLASFCSARLAQAAPDAVWADRRRTESEQTIRTARTATGAPRWAGVLMSLLRGRIPRMAGVARTVSKHGSLRQV